MASVAVAAASTGPATRAEVQDIFKVPSPDRRHWASQVPRPTCLLGYVATPTLGLAAFRPLSARLPAVTHGCITSLAA
jgi:hypothetical protein